MIRALIAAAALAPLLGGCVIYSSEGGERDVSVRVASSADFEPAPPPEAVRAVRFEGGRLTARVDSNGCTTAADFEVLLVGAGPAELTLNRSRPDLCRALVPDGVEVSWTYQELGLEAGETALVRNPIRLP